MGRRERRRPRQAADFLFHQWSLLAYGEPLFAKAFHILGLPEALPAVFHCAAGKDRTGILAADPGLARCPHELVSEDYGLSRGASSGLREWALVHNPEMAAAWDAVPANHMAAEPEAIARLLAGLAEEHGRSATTSCRSACRTRCCSTWSRRSSPPLLSGAGPRAGHSVASRRAASPPAGSPVTYPAPIEQVMTPVDQALLRSRRRRLVQRARERARARRRRGREPRALPNQRGQLRRGRRRRRTVADRLAVGVASGLAGFELVDQRALGTMDGCFDTVVATFTLSARSDLVGDLGRSRTG